MNISHIRNKQTNKHLIYMQLFTLNLYFFTLARSQDYTILIRMPQNM
jgi:hypothetical protein